MMIDDGKSIFRIIDKFLNSIVKTWINYDSLSVEKCLIIDSGEKHCKKLPVIPSGDGNINKSIMQFYNNLQVDCI